MRIYRASAAVAAGMLRDPRSFDALINGLNMIGTKKDYDMVYENRISNMSTMYTCHFANVYILLIYLKPNKCYLDSIYHVLPDMVYKKDCVLVYKNDYDIVYTHLSSDMYTLVDMLEIECYGEDHSYCNLQNK